MSSAHDRPHIPARPVELDERKIVQPAETIEGRAERVERVIADIHPELITSRSHADRVHTVLEMFDGRIISHGTQREVLHQSPEDYQDGVLERRSRAARRASLRRTEGLIGKNDERREREAQRASSIAENRALTVLGELNWHDRPGNRERLAALRDELWLRMQELPPDSEPVPGSVTEQLALFSSESVPPEMQAAIEIDAQEATTIAA